MLHGKSRVVQVLLRMAADPTLTEDALVDLLMDVLADDTYCPPQPPSSYRHSGEKFLHFYGIKMRDRAFFQGV